MLRPRGVRLGLAALVAAFLWLVPATAQTSASWKPNEDDSLLFDVRLGQYRLGDGARGYQTPTDICLNFKDIVSALDIPVQIDDAKGVANGWAFDERNKLTVDRHAGKVRVADRQLTLSPDTVRDTPDGWCVSAKALSSWLQIGVNPDLSNSIVRIESKTKLPVELAEERRAKAARIRPEEKIDLTKLPQVKLPYRLWRVPSLDAIITVGGLRDKRQGHRIDRQYDLFASGELAWMSVDARLSSDRKGEPNDFRLRAYRSDYGGNLLGPLHATHFEMGDISTFSSPIVSQSTAGRGFLVTNRPLDRPDTFDRKTFRGELPTGWDAELYRNGQLMAVSQDRSDGRYEFLDVPLLFGQNQIEIVLYGPQGQVRRNRETIAVGADSIPPRKTFYWASISDAGHDVIWTGDNHTSQDGWRGSMGLERGLDQRTSISAQVQSLMLNDERLTFVEGAVRRSIGPALVEVGGAYEAKGGLAGHAQVVAQLGQTYITAESLVSAHQFKSDRLDNGLKGIHVISLDRTFDLGRVTVPVNVSARYLQQVDGNDTLQVGGRMSANLGQISVTGGVDWFVQQTAGPEPPDRLQAQVLANGSIGKTRIRGGVTWRLMPSARFQSASVIAERRISDMATLRGEFGYDREQRRLRGALGYVRQFDRFALSVTGEAATDGSVAAGLNLAFSLGPDPRGGFRLASQKLAANGSLLARVFRDENGDGIREPDESYEKDVQVLVARRPIEKVTDAKGEVIASDLPPHVPVVVAVDASSLPDPLVAPAGFGAVVTPRPGLAVSVDLPLVATGEVIGTLVKLGGGTLQGVDIELIDKQGRSVATTRSDFDGYFLFDTVPYGTYSLRMTKVSAAAINMPQDLNTRITLSKASPSADLGQLKAGAQDQLRIAGAPAPVPAGARLSYQNVLMEGPSASLVIAR